MTFTSPLVPYTENAGDGRSQRQSKTLSVLSFTKIRRDRTSSLPLAWARSPRFPRIVHVRFNG
jgi:hypothetical protein